MARPARGDNFFSSRVPANLLAKALKRRKAAEVEDSSGYGLLDRLERSLGREANRYGPEKAMDDRSAPENIRFGLPSSSTSGPDIRGSYGLNPPQGMNGVRATQGASPDVSRQLHLRAPLIEPPRVAPAVAEAEADTADAEPPRAEQKDKLGVEVDKSNVLMMWVTGASGRVRSTD